MAARRIYMYGEQPWYWCPVCNHPHQVIVKGPFHPNQRWGWNGSLDEPTFTPSVRTFTPHQVKRFWLLKRNGAYFDNQRRFYDKAPAQREADARTAENGGAGWGVVERAEKRPERTICHVHVTKGMIRILNDSQRLGGQTVPLQEWDGDAYFNVGQQPPDSQGTETA